MLALPFVPFSSSFRLQELTEPVAKRFARPSSLRTHCYSHSGEQPYNCEFENCGRKFSVQVSSFLLESSGVRLLIRWVVAVELAATSQDSSSGGEQRYSFWIDAQGGE